MQYLTLEVMRSIGYKSYVRSWAQSGVYHNIYVYDKLTHVSYDVSCQLIVINYVSEQQLPHAIDTSHTTPSTHVNRGSKLLKLIGWEHCLYFKWVTYIPGTMAQTPDTEPGPTAR